MKIIKVIDSKIRIDLSTFKKPEPVLLHHHGMFCIIPIQIMRNALDLHIIYTKSDRKTMPPKIFFTWDQGIPVDPKVGYVLMGE